MYYKLHQQRSGQIPGIAVLLALILVVGGLISFFSHKNPEKKPKNANIPIERTEVANIRDNTVTIYWQTEKPTSGFIAYGASSSDIAMKAYDKRDIADSPAPRRNHVVTISNLTSNTDYYYNLFVDGASVGQTPEIPFQFKTAHYLKNPLNLDPIVGKIIEDGGKVAPEAIVLIYIGSAHPLLAQAKDDGSFAISPCCIFNSATYEPIFPQPDEGVIIEIIDESGATKKLTSTLGDIDSATSVIALSKDVKGSQEKGVILGESQSNLLQLAEDVQKVADIDIIFPRDKAVIPGTRPLIKGTGIAQKNVRVVLEPSGRIFETKIGSNKVWQFQPTFDLSPGEHTLKVTTQNDQNVPVVLERSFFIEKSGESVLGDATPSATLTPIASPTAELITETPMPTDILPTAVPSLPKTGSSIIPFGIASMVLVIMGAGMIFLL
jgi:hypothetical protein